jgi:hypothetical protein
MAGYRILLVFVLLALSCQVSKLESTNVDNNDYYYQDDVNDVGDDQVAML